MRLGDQFAGLTVADGGVDASSRFTSHAPPMLTVAVLFLVVGVSMGLLGGGGSILTVPILVYAFGLDAKAAIATSLLVVGVSSAFALVPYLHRELVDARIALIFGPVSMAGAFIGGALARELSDALLLGLFAGMMLATALAMLLRGAELPALKLPTSAGMRAFVLALEGAAVGVLTGLVGAGGGFLVVPALVLLAGLDMRRAVGTSLAIISVKSFAGLLGHVSHVPIDWSLGLALAAAAAVGAVAGGMLSRRISGPRLRRGFAALVAAAGVFVLASQLPAFGVATQAATGEPAH